VDEPVLPFVRNRGLTGDLVEDLSGARGLFERNEDFHLTKRPHIDRHHRADSLLRKHDEDALGLEHSPQDFGLGPTQIVGDNDGRLP